MPGYQHQFFNIFVFDGAQSVVELEPFDALHPLLLGWRLMVVHGAHQVNLRSHQYQLIHPAILEMDFAKPGQDLDMEESGFFANLPNRSLLRSLARLDVALGNRPATLGILDQQDFNILLIFAQAKNNPAGGWLAHHFLNRGLTKDTFGET